MLAILPSFCAPVDVSVSVSDLLRWLQGVDCPTQSTVYHQQTQKAIAGLIWEDVLALPSTLLTDLTSLSCAGK